jgi:hypothetical protein
MLSKKSILIILIFSSSLFSSDTIALNMNSDSVEIEGSRDITGYISSDGTTHYNVEASYLNHTYHYLFGTGISASGEVSQIDGLKFALGAKFIMSDNKQDSFFAIPLMAKAIYKLPIDEIPLSYVSAKFLYAPSSLSFSDALSYSEFRIQADVEIIDNISLFSGYRTIDTEYEEYGKSIDKSMYGGVEMKF